MQTYTKDVIKLCFNAKKSTAEIFPSTSPELLEILDSMLSFNPYFRPSAKDLLKNELFNNIRMPENEEPCPHKIVVDIDVEKPQSYNTDENVE